MPLPTQPEITVAITQIRALNELRDTPVDPYELVKLALLWL